jgi:HK97 gp10 family phage protein
MVKKNGVDLEGMNQLLKQLKHLNLKVDKAVEDKALKAGAEVAKEKIETHPNLPRSSIPKDHAQDNIIVVEESDGEYQIGAHKDFFYLIFHELGADGGLYYGTQDWNKDIAYVTPDIDASPFMRPAFEESQDEIQQAMAEVIKKELGL